MRAHVHFPVHTALSSERAGLHRLASVRVPVGFRKNVGLAEQGVVFAQGFRAQELCESRGGRPGLPVPNKPDGFSCGRKATLKRPGVHLHGSVMRKV